MPAEPLALVSFSLFDMLVNKEEADRNMIDV